MGHFLKCFSVLFPFYYQHDCLVPHYQLEVRILVRRLVEISSYKLRPKLILLGICDDLWLLLQHMVLLLLFPTAGPNMAPFSGRKDGPWRLYFTSCPGQDSCQLLLYTDGMCIIMHLAFALYLPCCTVKSELNTLGLLRKARTGMWKPSSLSETRMLKLVRRVRFWSRLFARLAYTPCRELMKRGLLFLTLESYLNLSNTVRFSNPATLQSVSLYLAVHAVWQLS